MRRYVLTVASQRVFQAGQSYDARTVTLSIIDLPSKIVHSSYSMLEAKIDKKAKVYLNEILEANMKDICLRVWSSKGFALDLKKKAKV